jgi:putative hydrolase of the HAD superfamily
VIFAFFAVFFIAKFLKLWYYTLYIDKVKKEVINMIKNIIFDCGRVIMQYDERYISSFFADNDEDIELLATVAMSRKYWNAFDEGTLAEEDYLREVKKELPERLHSAVEGLCAKWTSHMPPVPGMEAVVAEIKKAGRGIYLLSNFNKRLRNELYLAPSLLLFDGLVISGEIGMVKPNAEIYEYLLEKYNLKAEECIFVDDRQDNIDAGESVGIKGYLFDGDAEKFREYLQKENII